MTAHLCAHPGVCSAPKTGGARQKSGGTEKKIFPALCAGICAPHFQFASGASVTNFLVFANLATRRTEPGVLTRWSRGAHKIPVKVRRWKSTRKTVLIIILMKRFFYCFQFMLASTANDDKITNYPLLLLPPVKSSAHNLRPKGHTYELPTVGVIQRCIKILLYPLAFIGMCNFSHCICVFIFYFIFIIYYVIAYINCLHVRLIRVY